MIEGDEFNCAAAHDPCETPILRIGRHAVGLWMAAQELGDARLLAAIRPSVEAVGFALARDLVASEVADDPTH